MQFTDLSIRALKPPTSGYAYVWDSALRGFGIRLSAKSGSKTFCVLIGKGRRQTIGRYGPKPPDISLADAREAHVDADRMRGFKVREPRVEGGECGHRVNREKIIERCDEHARDGTWCCR